MRVAVAIVWVIVTPVIWLTHSPDVRSNMKIASVTCMILWFLMGFLPEKKK